MNHENTVINLWDKVALNFGKVGPTYWDDFGKRLVELSSIGPGARVLDIGMGRGSSMFSAVDKAGKGGFVTGIDNSEVMVRETARDILTKSKANVEVKFMDATKLDFEPCGFDNIICGFGFGYLLYGEDRLNGILRILKNGGEAAFSIWGTQPDQQWLTEIVERYLPPTENQKGSIKSNKPSLDNVDSIASILLNSGFRNVRVHLESSEVVYKDKQEWWQEMWSNAVRGILEKIQTLGSKTYERFEEDVSDGLENYLKGGKLYFNMQVIYAFGEKQH